MNNNIFFINQQHFINIKILLLTLLKCNTIDIYKYSEIQINKLFIGEILTIYVIRDIEIYKQYIKDYNDNNIFICIDNNNNDYQNIESIEQILQKYYSINIQITYKMLQAKNFINLLYKQILNVQEKENKSQNHKNEIIQLINKNTNYYALFNTNLKNKNDFVFIKKLKKYLYIYGTKEPDKQLIIKLYKETQKTSSTKIRSKKYDIQNQNKNR